METTNTQVNSTTPKGWTENEQKVIAMFIEKLGMERSNAVRKLRGMMLKGLKPEQILAQPLEPKLAQVQEPKAKKAKATPKPKAEKQSKFPKGFPTKAERMEKAKSSSKSELQIYIEACEKFDVKPAPSAAKAWAKAEKAAAKKEGK